MKKNPCHMREYYTVTSRGEVRFGLRCRHHPSLTFHTEQELRDFRKIHRKKQKKK